MRIIECPQTNSKWYKKNSNNGIPVGILWHDTNAGNPNISRYAQPSEGAVAEKELLEIIGTNKYKNDWNHMERDAGVNAFIGRIADGSVATVVCGPYTKTAWGCGKGSKGSCNGYVTKNGKDEWVGLYWVQFEICDDGYKSKEYFEQVFEEACQYTAYLCKQFGIEPFGTVSFAGVEVPTILCHKDSIDLGLGGGDHNDVYGWFTKYGKTMADVRKRVSEILGNDAPTQFSISDRVKLKPDATTYANGKTIPNWVKSSELFVRRVNDNGTVLVSILEAGDVTGTVRATDLEPAVKPKPEEPDGERTESGWVGIVCPCCGKRFRLE